MREDDPGGATGPSPGRRGSRALRWRWFNRAASIVQLVAVVAGMVAVIHEFGIQGPRDRVIREAQLHASIAHIIALKSGDTVGQSIQKIVDVLHADGRSLAGISVPGVFFRMAEFDGADWSGARMDGTEFRCSQLVYDQRGVFGRIDTALPPCARLRETHFSDARLNESVFDFADLRHSKFIRARLQNAEIVGSILSDADFTRAGMSGIHIDSSDLTNANFGTAIDFECDGEDTGYCAKVRSAVFREAKMPLARFFGADVAQVDFSNADLREAGFACHDRRDPRSCTQLVGVCFEQADLRGASFDNVAIVQADFSDAKLANAEFRNVEFESVVFPEYLRSSAVFDRASEASLERASVSKIGREEVDRPCASAWRLELLKLTEAFDFGGEARHSGTGSGS